MSTILVLIGIFFAAKVVGLFLAASANSDPLFDAFELSPLMIAAYLLGAVKNSSVIGAIVGIFVFHSEILAAARAFVGWPV